MVLPGGSLLVKAQRRLPETEHFDNRVQKLTSPSMGIDTQEGNIMEGEKPRSRIRYRVEYRNRETHEILREHDYPYDGGDPSLARTQRIPMAPPSTLLQLTRPHRRWVER